MLVCKYLSKWLKMRVRYINKDWNIKEQELTNFAFQNAKQVSY